jgi:hypothetical protein
MGYISNRSPHRYGMHLSDYKLREEQIVLRVQEQLVQRSHIPHRQLFNEILSYLGQERRQLAVDQDTKDAEHFGLMRNSLPTLQNVGAAMVTYLMKSYEEYGGALLQRLKTMPPSLSLGETRFVVQIFSFEELERRQWLKLDQDEYSQAFWRVVQTQGAAEFQRFLELHDRSRFSPFLQEFCGSMFLGTLLLQEQASWRPLTQYFARIHEDGWEGPVLFHQDFFHLKPMLETVADLFGQCIQPVNCNLEQTMARFCYLYSHAMPFSRGSALIREWLEQAIYRVHGRQIRYSQERALDLEAFASFSLEEFLPNYKQSIEAVAKL